MSLLSILTLASVMAGYLLFSSSAPPSTKATDLIGRASVIDGDTIEIHGRRIRLHGVDAPESNQLCTIDGSRYRCGQIAALALADFIGQRTVSCDQKGTDRYGRAVAVCSAGDEDLAAWLVSNGYALAYRRYSSDYVSAEENAAARHAGIWAGEFQAPWDWRRGEP